MAAPQYVYRADDDLLYRVVNGTAGDDIIHSNDDGGSVYDNILFHGRAGDDILTGGLGQDRIYGGAGDDTISGGWRDDRIFGGLGNDTINSSHLLRANGGPGNDGLKTEVTGDWLNPHDDTPLTFLNGGTGHDKFEVELGWTDNFDPSQAVYETAVIEDFKRGQGDRIHLLADEKLSLGFLTARQVFNRLDTDHNGALNNADGQSQYGSVSYDGDSLHLRQGQVEVDVLHVAQLTAKDFSFTIHDFVLG